MAKSPPPRQTSSKVSSIASGILSGNISNPTKAQIKSIAASALGQDQPRGRAPRSNKLRAVSRQYSPKPTRCPLLTEKRPPTAGCKGALN